MNARRPQALVVANPAAGGSPLVTAGTVIDHLVHRDFDVTSLLTARRGDAVEKVAETLRRGTSSNHPLDVVVAVGGDGTVGEVVEGILRGNGRWPSDAREHDAEIREAPALFVAPGGTGNSWYRALFADIALDVALDQVFGDGRPGARRRWLDAARLVERDQAVVLGASAGFLAQVLERARRITGVAGRQRYEQAALELLEHSDALGTDVRVVVDGVVVVEGRQLLVAVGGARHRGGAFELLPRSVLDDGLLDVCAIASTSRVRLGELLLAVTEGTHLNEPEVVYAQGTTVTIHALGTSPTPMESDGDVFEGDASHRLSATFEIICAALEVWAGDPPLSG